MGDNLWIIASAILAVIGVVLTIKWRNAKLLVKELAEFLTNLSEVIADDKVTKEELQQLLKEAKDVIEAARKLAGR